MGYIAVEAFSYYSTAGNNYSKSIIGIQTPIFVGIGGLVLGIVLMLVSVPFFPRFFARRPEVADPRVLSDAQPPVLPGEPVA
jgi:hypothetical protein